MDFELNLIFLFKFEFLGYWIHRDFVFTSINLLVLQHGQGVLQDGLQTLHFDLGDMHRPSQNMEEDMEFERRLSVKKFLEFESGK
jgi:hypothetical protein